MSLQTIIDTAQQIEIDRRRVVAQTLSRSQRLKTAERNSGQPWRFVVTPAGSLKYSDNRDLIELIAVNDRVTESEVTLDAASYLTAYQGQLNSTQTVTVLITATSTASFTLSSIPFIGDPISSRTVNVTAQSFSTETSVTYNRALSATRSDFLITNNQYQVNRDKIKVGDILNVTPNLTSSQQIVSITYNYIVLNSQGYTRIVMTAAADGGSAPATFDGEYNITLAVNSSTSVTSSTVMFEIGDVIQPNNSRYPYTVTSKILRGSGSTVTVPLNRSIITSESITLTGQGIKVGNSCSWRVVVIGLPTYQIVPYDRLQFTGNFELIEKII